jgi:hypothetical protein
MPFLNTLLPHVIVLKKSELNTYHIFIIQYFPRYTSRISNNLWKCFIQVRNTITNIRRQFIITAKYKKQSQKKEENRVSLFP